MFKQELRTFLTSTGYSFLCHIVERDNGNVHRAAAIDLQAEKAVRPAAPYALIGLKHNSLQNLKSGSPIEEAVIFILPIDGPVLRLAKFLNLTGEPNYVLPRN